jgi:hypothetical protein
MRSIRFLLLVVSLALAACDHVEITTGGRSPTSPANLALQNVATGLSSPLYLTAPSGDGRLFIVEQPGRIRIIQNGQLVATPFLDLTSVVSSDAQERGLLSLAFHPQFTSNGYFYVYYTDLNGDIRIDRFTAMSPNANTAAFATRKLILSIPHPGASNHNGGLALFGPDGMLYLGVGDGGTGGANGQALNTLLGKLLRIDVNSGDPYAIPSTNPYVGQAGARGEIWASGLRNPWRYAFDETDGNLYIADVGENSREEVDAVASTRAGVNYGWNIMEGSICFLTTTCSTAGLQLPIFEYNHTLGRCAIVGGFVYRGAAITGLVGHYFYSDNCAGGLHTFRYANGAITKAKDWNVSTGSVLSFGQDASKELYLLTATGIVSKIVAAGN